MKKHVDRISVTKMKIFRWVSGVARKDKIRMNKLLSIARTKDKIRENCLLLFGHLEYKNVQ